MKKEHELNVEIEWLDLFLHRKYIEKRELKRSNDFPDPEFRSNFHNQEDIAMMKMKKKEFPEFPVDSLTPVSLCTLRFH